MSDDPLMIEPIMEYRRACNLAGLTLEQSDRLRPFFESLLARAEAAEAECARLRGNDPKRGRYWLTVAGRQELRDTFDTHDDGNAVRPLLDALERAEAECARLRQDAERYEWAVANAVIETEQWRHDGRDPASTKHVLDRAIDRAIAEGKHET